MIKLKYYVAIGAALILSACASTSPFFSSWKAPDAAPLQVTGSKVAAVVMIEGEGTRRAAEDTLASELTARGAIGIPLYQLLPDADPEDEAAVREALKASGVAGLVVMRPLQTLTEVESTPAAYAGPRFSSFWGGYYGYGWGAAWEMGNDVRTDTIVHVETLVYSLKQNKLVWGGQSKTTNPSHIERLIKDTAGKVTTELERLGLLAISAPPAVN